MTDTPHAGAHAGPHGQELAEGPVGWRFKALPPQAAPYRGAQIPAQGYRLFEDGFEWPVMVLKEYALDANLEALAAFCDEHGALFAPHGKTALSPGLYARQEALGAWAVTVATPHQARVFRAGGARRIHYANPLVNTGFARWVQREMAADPRFGFTAYVDGIEGVRLLGAALDPHLPPLPVLVELGHAGGRTGCRTPEQALAVAQAAAAETALAVVGVAAYEGSVSHARTPDALAEVTGFLRTVRDTMSRIAHAGLLDARPGTGEWLVSCGGSIYYDIVARELASDWEVDGTAPDQHQDPGRKAPDGRRPVRLLLRSGAYASHDDGLYDRLARQAPGTPRLTPAIEVWTQVISTPEDGLALLDAGRRDLPFDEGLPVPLVHLPRRAGAQDAWTRDAARGAESLGDWTIDALNDQHAFLRFPAGSGPRVGDLLALGISHPCTAHDKWQLVPVVDEDYRVVDTARCFF
ncbi:alanine racemase [Streptomyces sp. NPDC056987]|uniref:alanine racemase n=1 Tax=Streptomyces sp. NPDC056987 TaxID=3345988 RepID=UPI003643F3BC